MSDNTLANDDTGSSDKQDQAQKTFTQKEVDDMMARTKHSVTKKYERMLEELGDLDELRTLKSDAEKRRTEEAKKRGEFDRLMAELAEKKDQEIKKRDEVIRNYTVDMPLVDLAAQLGAVNPTQVKQLLKPYVRLNEEGQVEILDDRGTVRYSDQGTPFGVKELVSEFLEQNLHFKAAGPSTTQSRSNINSRPERLDPTKFNMKDPAQRKQFQEWRKGNIQ
jgi:hypothetical protein